MFPLPLRRGLVNSALLINKTDSDDHWIMYFESFPIGLTIMGYEPLYMLYKYLPHTRLFGKFLFSFHLSLISSILGAFLIKHLFHSCLFDMRWL